MSTPPATSAAVTLPHSTSVSTTTVRRSTVAVTTTMTPVTTVATVSAVASATSSLMAAQFATMMTSMQQSISSLREELRRDQEESVEKAAKKARLSAEVTFKRKGNEKQYRFNEIVQDKFAAAALRIDEATSIMEASTSGATLASVSVSLATPRPSSTGVSSALQQAKVAIEEGMLAVKCRQKAIRLADRSELGWAVVTEYGEDELADDSDDEKRIAKAVATAEKKAAQLRKKKPGRGGYVQSRPAEAPYRAPHQLDPGYPGPRGLRQVGPCFACGEMGHLRRSCPKNQPPRPCPFNIDDHVCMYELYNSDVHNLSMDQAMSEPECFSTVENGYIWEPADEPSVGIQVQGSLKRHIEFWEQVLKAPDYIIESIRDGYVLPLFSAPSPFIGCNHKSALEHNEFVTNAVLDLLASNCILKVEDRPFICSPLSVVDVPNKKRLVINLRHLNSFLWKQTFKYEDLRTALLLFEKGDQAFTFDLKSGYHHVDIHPSCWKYLGFSWEIEGVRTYFVFKVLPFGLSSACYFFTKLLRPLVKFWRGHGLRIVVYLDDGICSVQADKAVSTSQFIQNTLEQAGFVAHPAKCQWTPSYQVSWLGFDIDLLIGAITVPRLKVEAIQSLIASALEQVVVTARFLASIVGKIISLSLAVGPVARFMTRSLYALLNQRQYWNDQLTLDEGATAELQFWKSSLQGYDSQPIWRQPGAVRVVYSDASDTGFGGYTVEHAGEVAHGHWDPLEAQQSSTWRELRAVGLVLDSLVVKLKNCTVRWFTDNQNVARILQVGSKTPLLQKEALHVFSLSVAHNVSIEPEWIPRSENQVADFISHLQDLDDWQLNPSVFYSLQVRWGPCTIDRFASYYNTQLPRFNSRYYNPGSEAVDAFTCDWGSEMNWWCPPIYLIPRILRHAQNCQCRGILVVPHWPSAPFWPLSAPLENPLPRLYVIGVTCLYQTNCSSMGEPAQDFLVVVCLLVGC